MTVRVLMLRRGGVRLPDGHSDSQWLKGTITLDGTWTLSNVYKRVSLRYPGDTHVMEPRHELFEPTLRTLSDRRLLLCGFEKKGAASVVQEWLIEFGPGS